VITPITYQKTLDVFEFLSKKIDRYNEFYVYLGQEKCYLKNLKEITKALKRRQIYASYKPNMKGLLTVWLAKDKASIKYIADSNKISNDLIRYLLGNWGDRDLYLTFNKSNPTVKYIQRFGFRLFKIEGNEVILFRVKEIRRAYEQKYNNSKEN